jgi:hypothetical protein
MYLWTAARPQGRDAATTEDDMTDDSGHTAGSPGEHLRSDLWTAGSHLAHAAGDGVRSVAHAGAAGLGLIAGDTDGAAHQWHEAGDDVSNAGAFLGWAGTETHHAWDGAAGQAHSVWQNLDH